MKRVLKWIGLAIVVLVVSFIAFIIVLESTMLSNWRINSCYETLTKSIANPKEFNDKNVREIAEKSCSSTVRWWWPGDMGSSPKDINYQSENGPEKHVLYSRSPLDEISDVKGANFIYLDYGDNTITLFSSGGEELNKKAF